MQAHLIRTSRQAAARAVAALAGVGLAGAWAVLGACAESTSRDDVQCPTAADCNEPPTPSPAGCEQAHGGCDPAATCEDSPDGPQCACPDGWSGDGLVCVAPPADSLFSQETLIKSEAPWAGENFGYAVAISRDGSTMAVCSEGAETFSLGGTVWVYQRVGDSWEYQARIKAAHDAYNIGFGTRLALSRDGNTLVVGAPLDSSAASGINQVPSGNSVAYSGAVYVYVRANGEWSQQAFIKASTNVSFSYFGSAVTLSDTGNVLAIGAPGDDAVSNGIDPSVGPAPGQGPGADNGAVYLFERSGAIWTQAHYIKAPVSNAQTYEDIFGTAVALTADGTGLAIGAPGEDSGSGGVDAPMNAAAPKSGRVYVLRKAGGVWSYEASMKASDPGADDRFGTSVAIDADGSTLAVGALFEDSFTMGIDGSPNENASHAGAAYVFVKGGAGWSQQAFVKAHAPDANDLFGAAVSLSSDGSLLAVTAQEEDGGSAGVGGEPNNDQPNSGAAYVFVRDGSSWSQRDYIKASNVDNGDYFGYSTALAGDTSTLVIGALWESTGNPGVGAEDNELVPQSGAVYVFD